MNEKKEKIMRKLITINTKAALVEVDYNTDDQTYVAKIKAISFGLKPTRDELGKTPEEAMGLVRKALMTINGVEVSHVIDVSQQQFDDDTNLLLNCINYCSLHLRAATKGCNPNLIFKHIEEKGFEGKRIDEYNGVYSAKDAEKIRSFLINDVALTEFVQFWLMLDAPQV